MESVDRALYIANPIMDSNRSPSAFYLSENSFFPGEVTYCKSEVLPDQYGTACRKQIIFGQGTETACRKQVASSLFDHLDPFALHDQRVDLSSDLTALRTSNGTTVSARIPPSENSLFSSSLPELYSRKLEASSKYTHFDRSVVAAPFNNDEEEPLTSLEEIEAQTIGNLLPDDDDLFGGVTDGLERVMQPNNGGDVEELDFFCNMGGMDLGDCDFSTGQQYIKSGTNLEEHPFGEHPSRMLLVRNVNSNVEDSELRTLFEQYGDICNLYTASKQRGFLKISYYDLRAAQKAMKSLQKTLLRGNRIDIHYSIPKDNPSKKEKNQGILIASNLDCSVSNDGLRNIFCIYGDIKEIQSVSRSNHQKLIGFFDSRAAESALRALHGSNIAGKQIKLEPVGIQDLSKLPIELQQQSAIQIPFLGSPVQNGISSTVPDSLENKTDYSLDQLKFDTWGSSPNLHPRSLGEYRDGFMNGFHSTDSQQLHRFSSNGHPLVQGSVFGSVGNGSSPRTGHGSIWGNSYNSQSPSMMWPSYDNGIPDLHRSLSPMLKTALHSNNHHIGSAPAVNPTIWDRHQPYAAGSPETSSIFHSGSWGNSGISKSPLHLMDFVPHNIFSHVGGNCTDPSTVVGVGLHSHHQRCMMFPGRGQRLPGLCPFDPPNERVRIRRASSQADKKHFELDIERIIQGEDSRTTLMIKNIPNKYTSKMLLAAIDELHRGTYDFIYLPIDFKNKCNVGYAFINMTDPSQIIPFYKAFNGKKWEKFNSEKVASLAYARIQGKAALLAHFQNSSLMNEDKRCRPILFNTGGPNAGDQVPFPMGVNVRSRAGKTRISSLEEKIHVGGDHSYSKKEESTSSDLEIPSK